MSLQDMANNLGISKVVSTAPQTGANLSSGIITLLVIIGVAIVFGIVVFAIYYKKALKKNFYITVNLFKIVNGKRYWITSDKARELTIPGTNVRLLYWQAKKIYSAYPTRSIGLNVYAYTVNRIGELSNFDFAEGNDETEAKIDYDHRDQTYAYLNLQEVINRNYKDKTVKWWKENMPLISIIICVVLLAFDMWFFTNRISMLLDKMAPIAQNFNTGAQAMATALDKLSNLNSGIKV